MELPLMETDSGIVEPFVPSVRRRTGGGTLAIDDWSAPGAEPSIFFWTVGVSSVMNRGRFTFDSSRAGILLFAAGV